MPNVIRAPFNFVPLNNEVFFPDWADKISHDVPFSDGISGQIELTITAETPIFIGDGKSDDPNNHDPLRFAQLPDGRYFIPGTSLKGAIRNVLEVLSFGKMSRVQNRRFSVRDLRDQAYTEFLKQRDIHCGWMWLDGDDYHIDDCGEPYLIRMEDIDDELHCGLVNFVMTKSFRSTNEKVAKAKYDLVRDLSRLEGTFEVFAQAGKLKYVRFARHGSKGTEGVIVFTGQNGRRKTLEHRLGEAKFSEYVFPKNVVAKDVLVPRHVGREFEDINAQTPNFIRDKGQLWFRGKELQEGKRIPVFFTYGDNLEVDAIGLSYMFRYPTYHTTRTAMRQQNANIFSTKADLAECLFGYTAKATSLRGRVHFSHALACDNVHPMQPIPLVLSTPRASFYPLYLQGGKSWNSKDAKIAGRKRYPTRERVLLSNVSNADSPENERIITKIAPLPSNTKFKSVVRFHNLRPFELGALLSALTFVNQPECYHNIGMAKPFGYGKVKIEVSMEDYLRYVETFRAGMTSWKSDWSSSAQLKELFALAKGIPADRNNEFTYLSSDPQDFSQVKIALRNGVVWGYFSELIDGTARDVRADARTTLSSVRKTYLSEEEQETERLRREIKAQKERERQEQEEARRRAEEERESAERERVSQTGQLEIKARGLMSGRNFAEAIEAFKEAGDLGVKSFETEIAQCEAEIAKKEEKANETVEQWIAGVAVASINAFANRLRSRNNDCPLAESELEPIATHLRIEVAKKKSKEQKDWKNLGKWGPIKDAIGEELAKKLFDLAFGEGAK